MKSEAPSTREITMQIKTLTPSVLTLALALVACGQQDRAQTPTASSPESAVARLDVLQGSPVVGQAHNVEVKAYDANNREVALASTDLVWEVKNPEVLRMDAPGKFTPLKAGETVLTVRTRDGRTYTEYPEVVWQKGSFQPTVETLGNLVAQAAPGHSYAELNTNWSRYVNNSVDLYGNLCSGSANDCGQCTGLAKAFGNQTPYDRTTQSWFSGGRVLTSGNWPSLNVALGSGDAIATMEPYNGDLRYSLADYAGTGHVALFASYSKTSTDVSIFVRDQNYVTPLKVGSHTFFVPKVNGIPYCSTSTSTDTANICNYHKVAVR